ncbi:MAG: hypothetical protein ACLFWG_07665, partial [Longimicrobiales bacterium]
SPMVYGFDVPPDVAPGWAEDVRVSDATSLDVVARAAGVDVDEVVRINPHLVRGYTPPDRETTLRVRPGRQPGSPRCSRRFPRTSGSPSWSTRSVRVRP